MTWLKKNRSGGFKLMVELWKSGLLEEKLMAVKIVGMIAKKDPGRSIKITEQFAKNIGNWAVCDALGM
jgi:3-methyladenine DNA glycosylase AlkD